MGVAAWLAIVVPGHLRLNGKKVKSPAAPAAAVAAASGEVNVAIVERMVLAGATSHPQIVQAAVDPSMPVPWRPPAAEVCHLALFCY